MKNPPIPLDLFSGVDMKALHRRGFTLLEIIVVVLIIGLLAGLAFPFYRRSMENSMADQAKAVLESIGTANRVYAMEKGEPARGQMNNESVLVANKYVPGQDWDRMPYYYELAPPLSNCLMASTNRKGTGPYGIGDPTYNSVGFCISNTGVITPIGSRGPCGLCRGPVNCFAAGTRVRTPQGLVAIEKLKIGDPVYSVDPRSRDLVRTVVTHTFSRSADTSLLTLSDGRSLRATGEHLLYDPGAARYKPLREFAAGESVLTYDPKLGRVEPLLVAAVKTLEPIREFVYNLEVESELHNYLAEGVLAHNRCEVGL